MLKKPVIILVQAVIVVAIVEVSARALFPNYTDDEVFLNRAYSHLLNTSVRVKPKSNNYSRKFGFVLTAYSESTDTTEEFTYTSKTNSKGFRTREIQLADDDEYRVMLLGDSMFYGIGVQESGMVSSFLEEQGKPGLSVYSYAVTGYNTVQEMIVAETYAGALNPDHIIVGFFIANDILPNAIAFIDEDGNYSTSDEMELMIRRKLREGLGLLYHSTTLRIIAQRVYIPRLRYQIATDHNLISRSYALLGDLNHFARAHDARFSVVIMYPRDSVQGGLVQSWSSSREAGELIHAFCKKNSIEVLDLIDYMNTAADKDQYFFKYDGHPNEEGNALIAEAIYKDLIEPHGIQ
jgi:hypothetical protein